nr:MAG TPA: hypothetical protein [Caudoviricetes sp.]
MTSPSHRSLYIYSLRRSCQLYLYNIRLLFGVLLFIVTPIRTKTIYIHIKNVEKQV